MSSVLYRAHFQFRNNSFVVVVIDIFFQTVDLPYMINFVKTFGTNIVSEPLVFLEGFEGLGNDMSILNALIFESLAHIFIGIGAMAFILLMSEKLKSAVTAMTVSTAVTLIPCLMVYFDGGLRLFGFFQSGKPWALTVIIVLSVIISVTLLVYNFITFTGSSLRGRKNGT